MLKKFYYLVKADIMCLDKWT